MTTSLILSLGLMMATESPMLATLAEERSARIRRAYDDVRVDNLYLLDELYDEKMVFQDPLDRMEGLHEFKIYMEAMYQYVTDIKWTYHDEIIDGDTHVLVWTMTLTTKGLNKGKPFTIDGVSHLKFGESDKIIFHRDYFDMGEYIYERVPVVNWFVNKVKKSLHEAVAEAREKIEKEKDAAKP